MYLNFGFWNSTSGSCSGSATNKFIKTASQGDFSERISGECPCGNNNNSQTKAGIKTAYNDYELTAAAAATEVAACCSCGRCRSRMRHCNWHRQTQGHCLRLALLTLFISLTIAQAVQVVPNSSAKVTIIAAAATTTTSTTVTAATTATTTTKTQNATNVVSLFKGIPTAAAPSGLPSVSQFNSALHLRKRHRKRNSNWYDYNDFNENTTHLEWSNPCGGYFIGHQQQRRKNQKQIFNLLKRAAGNEYLSLNSSQKDIDISNIQIWFLHDFHYKFLPKLKINSSIALKRWYRNMQTYVASFAYLRRAQLKWDRSHSKRESRTARELKDLLLSSRSMLCQLETAVNQTYPMHEQRTKSPTSPHKRHLQQFTRAQMNKRLKLRTKRRLERRNASDGGGSGSGTEPALQETDTMDLQFVKYYYYEFLKTMWKLLRQNSKRQGDEQLQQRQRLQLRLHQRQRQRQRHRPQQHRLRVRQLRLISARHNHNEFNEVEKPQNGNAAANGSSRPRRGSRATTAINTGSGVGKRSNGKHGRSGAQRRQSPNHAHPTQHN